MTYGCILSFDISKLSSHQCEFSTKKWFASNLPLCSAARVKVWKYIQIIKKRRGELRNNKTFTVLKYVPQAEFQADLAELQGRRRAEPEPTPLSTLSALFRLNLSIRTHLEADPNHSLVRFASLLGEVPLHLHVDRIMVDRQTVPRLVDGVLEPGQRGPHIGGCGHDPETGPD